jgi:hypothetical protein
MRALNVDGQALQVRRLAGDASVQVITLVYIGFAVPQRWALTGLQQLIWDDGTADTWTGREVMLSNLQTEVGDLSSLQITLSGVTDAERALAFADVEGDPVKIYRAWVDLADNATAADALLWWEGEIDIPGWTAGRDAFLHFTAESRASIALRPSPSRYTHDEQQRLYTGDTSLDFDPATDAAPVVWPAASYFRV